LTSDKVEKDLAREIEVHVEQLARQYMTEGMGERDAWLHARREFGPVEVLKEECRDARLVGWTLLAPFASILLPQSSQLSLESVSTWRFLA
jgi:hypothetical protein